MAQQKQEPQSEKKQQTRRSHFWVLWAVVFVVLLPSLHLPNAAAESP